MKRNKIFCFSTLLLAVGCILQFVAHTILGFADWYSIHVYPIFTRIFGVLSSIFPFSLIEILLYIGGILVCLSVLKGMYLLFRAKQGKRKYFMRQLKLAFCAGSILLFLYTINCGINYQRTGIFDSITEKENAWSAEELYQLTNYFALLANELSTQKSDTIVHIQETAIASMKKLGEQYEGLTGYYPTAKPVLKSELLSYQQLTGVYSPFTVEANYNNDMPEYYKPFTICHELSHVKGYMKEDEANYIAILACLGSNSKDFQYSGAILAYTYCSNALYSSDKDKYKQVASILNGSTKQWLIANSKFWNQYEGKVAKVSEKANDIYLKANAQENGVKSYGMVVDLLLTEFEKQKLDESNFVNIK